MKNPSQVYACVVNVYGAVEGNMMSSVRFFHLAVSSYQEACRQANVIARELYEELDLNPASPTLRTQIIIERATAAELMTFGHIAAIGEDQEQRLQSLQTSRSQRH